MPDISCFRLEELPVEVQARVGMFLDVEDIESVALTGNANTTAALLGTRDDTQSMSIMIRSENSLRVCLTMVRDPGVARKVQALYLNIEECTEDTFKYRDILLAHMKVYGQVPTDEHMEAYSRLLEQQQKFQGEQREIALLSDIFACLEAVNNPIKLILTSNANCYGHWMCSFEATHWDEGRWLDERSIGEADCGICRQRRTLSCNECTELRPFYYERLSASL